MNYTDTSLKGIIRENIEDKEIIRVAVKLYLNEGAFDVDKAEKELSELLCKKLINTKYEEEANKHIPAKPRKPVVDEPIDSETEHHCNLCKWEVKL